MWGISGGEDGKKGNNFLIRKCGRKIRLPSKSSVKVQKGVSILLTLKDKIFSNIKERNMFLLLLKLHECR